MGGTDTGGVGETAVRVDACDNAKPMMIVEYKAPEVVITQAVFDQIARYGMVLRAEYLTVSNGLQHFCCKIDYAAGTYCFLADIPDYSSIV